jgi:hypothetical protein
MPGELASLVREASESIGRAGVLCAGGGSQGLRECPALLECACRNLSCAQAILRSASPELRAEMTPALLALARQVANFHQLLEAAGGFYRAIALPSGDDAVAYHPGVPALDPSPAAPAGMVG